MNQRIPPPVLDSLVEKIVTETVPEEITAYKLTGRKIIVDVLNGHDPQKAKRLPFGNEFGGEVGDWASFIQIIVATASLAVQCVQSSGHRPREQTLADRWTEELKKTGLKDELSVSIPQKFIHEFRVTIQVATDENSPDRE